MTRFPPKHLSDSQEGGGGTLDENTQLSYSYAKIARAVGIAGSNSRKPEQMVEGNTATQGLTSYLSDGRNHVEAVPVVGLLQRR